MSGTQETQTVEIVSGMAFAPTLERLVQKIATAGMTIFARIDHAAGAREVGMEMPPTVVLLYGHPRGGTPIMLAAPQAALDLPLRVLVREEAEGQTLVSFHPIGPALVQAGVPETLAMRLEPGQSLLVKAFQSGQAETEVI
jgi:uncharacterized protein (DUF302 family)